MIEHMFDVIDQMEPGPELGHMLSAVDIGTLSGAERVVVLRARQRMVSHHQAMVYRDMAAVADHMAALDDHPEFATEAAAAELRAALRLTRRAADLELSTALDLRDRLPRVWELLARGEIDTRRAVEIVRGTGHLPPGTARSVVESVLAAAPGLTTGQLRERLRRACLAADPADSRRRYEGSVADRRVVTEPTDAGTGNVFGLDLPPDRVVEASRNIDRLARRLRGPHEARTMDQLRADVFLDLLSGGRRSTPGGRASVELRVDLETLAGLSEDPGELNGFGPVVADVARRVAHESRGTWRFTVTDGGRPVVQGTTRRRPTEAERQAVIATDPTCIFPGCRMPATECDLDHRVPWSEGGPTTVEQLVPLCRHDHVIRHRHGWTHEPTPDGDHRWTSPLGQVVTTSGRSP